jgi:DNA-directed RNA polymerase specialized sigma24 family protein
VSIDEVSIVANGVDPTDVLTVSLALDDLALRSADAARAFELQFFGGLAIADIADLLGVSEKKVQRLLRFARSALTVALAPGRESLSSPPHGFNRSRPPD